MDGGEEQGPRDFPRALIGAESLAHRRSRSRRPAGVRGVDYRDYPFRATPLRIATALRFAKCALYLRLWHEWTAEDQQVFDSHVVPLIVQHKKWTGFAEIENFIFTWFGNARGNRRDWTACYARAYTRSLGF